MSYRSRGRHTWPVSTWELLLVSVLMLYLLGLDIHGLVGYNSLRRELKSLERACAELQRNQVKRLQYLRARGSSQLEDGWIRQELGFVKPGEIAVVFLKGTHGHGNR